jgi:hypothetical protein
LPNDEEQKLSLLARLVVASILALIVAGIVWHGVSIPIFQRIWHDLIERPDAPVRFRFILQPLMAGDRRDPRWSQGRAERQVALFLDDAGQPARAHPAAERRIECDRQDNPSRARDGRDLSSLCAKAVLSSRGDHRRTAVCFCPLHDHARAGHAHRASMGRRNGASNLVRAPI